MHIGFPVGNDYKTELDIDLLSAHQQVQIICTVFKLFIK